MLHNEGNTLRLLSLLQIGTFGEAQGPQVHVSFHLPS
jgi:hypothetical protein